MAGKSNIEWTEQTWNPVVGCSIVSPGCTNCYAMKMAARIQKMNRTGGHGSGYVNHYDGTTKVVNGKPIWTGKLALARDALFLEPLRRKKPTVYFVNSMGDLFHEDCPDDWISRVFGVMAQAPQHTFQVLTKRAKRMRDYCNTIQKYGRIEFLPNVWLGVSTERQQEADERIPELLQTPAAVRFISAEPLLGAIDLRPWLSEGSGCEHCDDDRGPGGGPLCHSDRIPREQQCPERLAIFEHDEGPVDEDGAPAWITPRRINLDWVIVGGESGPGSRPMHPEWARSLRDQCLAADVSFFFKQWGTWGPDAGYKGEIGRDPIFEGRGPCAKFTDDKWEFAENGFTMPLGGDREWMYRLGKKAAGRLLDGELHDAMPERAA
jgi:protein gp37